MRRLRTLGLPGDRETNPRNCWWDFRRGPQGWVLELPWVDPGGRHARPSNPAQVAWLAARGLHPDPVLGRLPLDADQLDALLASLDVVDTPWAAYEALDAIDALELAGDREGALATSERLRDLAPGWDLGRRRRQNLLIHGLRDADAASADLDSLPAGALPADEIRRNRQTIALLRDDWATYAQYASARVEGGEREPWAWETLGLAWWAAGRLDLSLEALGEGLALHPGNRDLELRRAEVLEAMGDHAAALAHLDALAAEPPPHAKTLALRGWFRRMEAPDAAAADYAAALALDPEQPVARVGRGLMRLEAGDRAGARADLQPFTHCGWTEAAAAWRRFQEGEGG